MCKVNPGAFHPVGTRYSIAGIYDEATNETIHGWQVFVQKMPDGTETGRRSFVDNSGNLCGLEIAEDKRRQATSDAAPMLLDALKGLLAIWPYIECNQTRAAVKAIESAGGVRQE